MEQRKMKLYKRLICIFLIASMMLQTGCSLFADRYQMANGEESILNGALKQNDEGTVWKISNKEIEKALKGYCEIEFLQENLLIVGEEEAQLFSMENGEVLGKADYSKYDSPEVTVCGDKLAVNAFEEGEIKVFDSNLKEVWTYELQEEYDAVIIGKDATKAFCVSEQLEQGPIVLDLETGEKQTIAIKNDCLAGVNWPFVVSISTMDIVSMFDLESESIKDIPFMNQCYDLVNHGNYWLSKEYFDDEKCCYHYSNSVENYSIVSEKSDTNFFLVDGPATIFEKCYEESENQNFLYDEKGAFLSEYISEKGDVESPLAWSEECGGYFFVERKESFFSFKRYLMFWDVGTKEKGENLTLQLEYSFGGNIYENGLQTCYDRAVELGEKYGISIKVGEQCATVHYDSYTMQQETNAVEIHKAFHIFESAMRNYPEGFMKQLTYGTKEKMELSFVGRINDGGKSEYGAGGFTSGKRNEIYIDISTSETELTYYHEIMHLIDYKLQNDRKINGKEWNKLNPTGYKYLNEYKNVDEKTLETYKDWFVKNYSHVNWMEDRATIMEQAMAGNTEVFKGKTQLIEKLEFLCKNIRENFDTTGWPEQLPCEKTLEECQADLN